MASLKQGGGTQIKRPTSMQLVICRHHLPHVRRHTVWLSSPGAYRVRASAIRKKAKYKAALLNPSGKSGKVVDGKDAMRCCDLDLLLIMQFSRTLFTR